MKIKILKKCNITLEIKNQVLKINLLDYEIKIENKIDITGTVPNRLPNTKSTIYFPYKNNFFQLIVKANVYYRPDESLTLHYIAGKNNKKGFLELGKGEYKFID